MGSSPGLKKCMHEGFVDDGDVLGRGGVLFGDGAAADDLLAQGFEIAGADVIPGRADVLIAHAGHGVTLADDDFAPVVLKRRVLREGGALDAGDVGEAILQFAVHGIELGLRVGGVGRGEADGDAVVGFVAEVLVLHVHEAAGEQAGAGEQDDGERRLEDDEDLLRKEERSRVLRLAPRRASAGSACEANHAGAVPKSAPVTSDKAKAKAEHGQGGRCVDGDELRAVEGEGDDEL